MTKAEAIERYRAIQSGAGVKRDDYLESFGAGEIAKRLWDEERFTLGIEYGYLIALTECFQITPEDLGIKI